MSADQYGEQTYIKQGIDPGHITNPDQVLFWIESIGVCSRLAMTMDEEGSERWELNLYDRLRTLTKPRMHSPPLTHQSDSLYKIVSGQVVSETEVNVQAVLDLGLRWPLGNNVIEKSSTS